MNVSVQYMMYSCVSGVPKLALEKMAIKWCVYVCVCVCVCVYVCVFW